MESKKLIYADDARRAILETEPKLAYCIDRIKCVDAVEVVRCKDCKWFNKSGYDNSHEDDLTLHMGYCHEWRRGTQACSFCSYGERKDNDI